MPSTEAGFLLPLDSPPEDSALLDALQPWIAGVTGLPGELVRPADQLEPGNIPDKAVNWCAFFVAEQPATTDVVLAPTEDGLGTTLQRPQNLSLRLSFYGPACGHFASLMNDGLRLAQNRDALRDQHIVVVGSGQLTRLPELVKDQWYQRCDLPLALQRGIIRTYEVRSLISASGDLNNEHYITPIEVTS